MGQSILSCSTRFAPNTNPCRHCCCRYIVVTHLRVVVILYYSGFFLKYFNLGLLFFEKHPTQNLIVFFYTTSAKPHDIFDGLVMEIKVNPEKCPFFPMYLPNGEYSDMFIPRKIVATPFPRFDTIPPLGRVPLAENSFIAFYPKLIGTLAIVFKWHEDVYL